MFLQILRRRKWVMLACVVSIPLAIYFISAQIPKTYEASVILQVQPSSVDTSLFDSVGGGATPLPSAAVVDAAAKMAHTLALAAQAARQLNDNRTSPTSLLAKTSVTTDATSGFITIAATDRSATQSEMIANAFGQAVIFTRAKQARSQIYRTIGDLLQQFRALNSSDQNARVQLSDQIQRLRAMAAAQGNNAQIVAPATVPKSPVSPRPVRNTILALVVALLLSVALAFAFERLSPRIRTSQEFEELTGVPLLGTVPVSALRGSNPRSTREAFQMIRTTLLSFNEPKSVKTILVTSPGPEEGKTTVAINLAHSLARGGKEVILVDCDLRKPRIASRLKLEHRDLGLTEILTRDLPLTAPLAEARWEDATLRVLPAGTPPINPSDLLNSDRMRHLLDSLGEGADFLILDSTPLLHVSDAIPLLPWVAGVVGLARVDKTKRDDIRRFQEVLTLSGGRLVGIVATGVRDERDGYGYRYAAATPATSGVLLTPIPGNEASLRHAPSGLDVGNPE